MSEYKGLIFPSLLMLISDLGEDNYDDWYDRVYPQTPGGYGDDEFMDELLDRIMMHLDNSKFNLFVESNYELLSSLSMIENGYLQLSRSTSTPSYVRSNIMEIIDIYTDQLIQDFSKCIDWTLFKPV